jgi:hypothetical protein
LLQCQGTPHSILANISKQVSPSPERQQEQSRVTAPRPVPPIDVNGINAMTLKPHIDPTTTRQPAHSRDSSLNKNTLTGLSSNAAAPETRHNGTLSPRFAPGRSRAGSGGLDNNLMPYGHHRQTSIVHGVQHSRNGSFASSSSSPLSPQTIAAAGGGSADFFNMARVDNDSASPLSNMSATSSFSTTSTLVSDRASSATESSVNTVTHKRLERMHSGRSRRDGHHPSHSRHHHKEEIKTVGEYALHVLFTSVSFCHNIYLVPL